jgi:hypothetical protein
MLNFQPVTREAHSGKYWRRLSSFNFARADTVVQLVLQEVPRAAAAMPVALVPSGEHMVPAAVLGATSGSNAFVDASGRWTVDYVPAAYRGYPFMFAQGPGGQHVLCVDDECETLNDSGGLPFFAEDGEPSAELQRVVDYLTRLAENRVHTQRACDLLQQHGLVEPWPAPVTVREEKRTLGGLFRVAEQKLQSLEGAALEELMRSGALALAYCHLLSTQHLEFLGRRASRREREAGVEALTGADIDELFGEKDEVLRFDFD